MTSLAANRYRSLRFVPTPAWLQDSAAPTGVVPSLRDLNTNLMTVFHSYRDPPAKVRTTFETGETIEIFVGPDEQIFAVIRDKHGNPIRSKSQATMVGIEGIAVQPQVAPVQESERRLDIRTVERGLDSPLAPLHFRNQLHLLGSQTFKQFKLLTEDTWPSLQIRELEVPGNTDDPLRLFVRDGKHVGELATMGHGLQMWLQVMWFLARNTDSPTIVLDEPDVYMHADVQRRLMRLLRRRHQQVIVATHSIEILSEVAPEDVLVVTSELRASRWASGTKGVQKVIENIGGVHNLQLSRLAQAKKCLFVEGNDLNYLRKFNDALFPDADALDAIPNMSVGGWTGWPKVDGSAQFLKNTAGDLISSYSIFDSDYHLPSEVTARFDKAVAIGVRLHVFLRKEIENYLLVPSAIARLITMRSRSADSSTVLADVEREVERVCLELVEDAVEGYTTLYNDLNRGNTSAGKAARWARKYVDARLTEQDGTTAVIHGKDAVRAVSAWSKTQFDVSLSSIAIAAILNPDEIAAEIRELLAAIAANSEIPSVYAEAWRTRASQ
ncbi:MAG: AAA family ATPase [Ilumatobacteraceae bacterium]